MEFFEVDIVISTTLFPACDLDLQTLIYWLIINEHYWIITIVSESSSFQHQFRNIVRNEDSKALPLGIID